MRNIGSVRYLWYSFNRIGLSWCEAWYCRMNCWGEFANDGALRNLSFLTLGFKSQFENLTKILSAPNSSIFASIASVSVMRPFSDCFGSMTITFSPIDSIDFKHDFWSIRGQIILFACGRCSFKLIKHSRRAMPVAIGKTIEDFMCFHQLKNIFLQIHNPYTLNRNQFETKFVPCHFFGPKCSVARVQTMKSSTKKVDGHVKS